jgi:hypothetical protein
VLENIKFLLLVCRNLINSKSNLSHQIDKYYNNINDSKSISQRSKYIRLCKLFIGLIVFFTPESIFIDFIHFIKIAVKFNSSYFEGILLINVTFLGVVIPFVTMSHEKVTNILPRDRKNDAIHKFLKTKQLILHLICFSLLIALILFFVSSEGQAWLIIDCFCLCWLLMSSWRIYIFISNSLKLTDNPILLLRFLFQDYISDQYRKEIKAYMKTNLYINFIASQNRLVDEDRRYPSVSLLLHRSDKQSSKVQKNFLQLKTLSDISLANLELVIASWIKRNTMIKSNSDNFSHTPKMTLPLYPSGRYQGEITLCVIEGVAPLSWLEKAVINYCTFKFVKPTGASSITSIELLGYYRDIIIQTIKLEDQALFDKVLDELVETHLILLKCGEVKDKDGKVMNLSTINKSYFNNLQKEWIEIYRDVIKNTIDVLPKNDYFFSICSRVFANQLIPSVLKNPSMISLSDLIKMHGYFLYELNKSQKSGRLKSSTYLEVLRDFIGIRESIHRTLIEAAESVNTWDSFNNLFKGFNEYLTSTITFLAGAVLSKNEKAANILVGSLLEFSEFLDGKVSSDHCYNLLTYDKSAQALIVPTLLNKSLDEVKQIFSSLKMYDKIKDIKERTLFFNILKNYWEDCCFIMIAFFLLFQKKSNNSVNELAINITRPLRNTKLVDHYFTSFIRRNAYHHFNDEEYGAMLDELARHIVSLTEEEKVPLRAYVTVGSSIDEICDADIIIAAIIISLRFHDDEDACNGYTPLMEFLCKNDLIQNLINKIETILKEINPQHVKTTQLYKEFVAIYDRWCVKGVKGGSIESASPPNTDTDVNRADISAKETPLDLIDKLNKISIIFKALLQSAKDAQSRYIKDLPISQEKLNDIAKKCSTKAFDKNTAYFPVNHFKEVVPVEEELNKFTLTLKGLSKRKFTEEESRIIHYANDGYEYCVSEHLYKYLVLDILAEAKKSNVVEIINVNTKAEYIEKILKYGALLKKKNLTPILIAEDCTSPEWVNEWNNARWGIDNKLVDERAEIKYYFSHNNPPNYLFHINSIPLYIGRAITDGTLLLPKEILRTLKFRKYDSGNLVNVTFEQQDNNPQQGSLIFSWERTIELDLQYKIYNITYPKSIDEE